jgi:hypothetical protein
MGKAVIAKENTCENNTATIEAQANHGYKFLRWHDGSTVNPLSVTVNEDVSYTAYFEKEKYYVTVESADPSMGYTVGSGSFEYNTTASSIGAIPLPGNYFVEWSDGNKNDWRNDELVTRDTTYTAIFAAFEKEAELISLSINGKPIEMDSESETEMEYTAPCYETEVSLDIQHSDEAEMTLSVDGGNRIGETDIRLTEDVTNVKIKIDSKDGKRNSTHNLHIYRSFEGDGLIIRRWPHVIAINTNPKTNGGYSNIGDFRWHLGTDSATIHGTQQFLTIAPEKAKDYHVEISIDKKWHRVCGVPESQNVSNITAYPNPVTIGENLTLKLPLEFVGGRMDVISIGGTVMKRNVPLPNMQTDVSFHDLPSGVYMLKIMSINGNSETVKIIVGN